MIEAASYNNQQISLTWTFTSNLNIIIIVQTKTDNKKILT